jgi:predicted Zn-dependent protease
MQPVQSKKPYVATYKEIIIGFIAFSLLLILLYPKEMLKEQILSENANYDLSILYLQNMLKHDPTNETLLLALAKQSVKANKKDLAYKLLKLLRNSKNKDVRIQTYILSYTIAKQDYIYLQKKHKYKKLNKVHTELKQIFNTLISNHYYKKLDIQQLYKEAIFLQDYNNQYILLQQIIKNTPNNKKYLQDAYYLAYKLHKYNDAIQYLEQLSKIDIKNRHKWYDEKYYIIVKAYSFAQAEFHLKKEARHSKYWEKRLINFYLDRKQYKKASKIYMQLFKQTSDFVQKRTLWMQAIQTLRAGNYNKEAIKIAHHYENYFLKDKKARVYLLKLYLALNDLQSAKELSKKILKLQR